MNKNLSTNTVLNQERKLALKREQINNLIKEVLYNSLAQSIIKIVQTPNLLLKIYLFTFVVISSGLTCYLIIQSINNYLSFQVITTYRTFYETAALFPQVTFCNLNKYTTKFAFDFSETNKSDANLTSQEKKNLSHMLDRILFNCFFNYKPCNSSDFVWIYDNNYGNCYSFNSGFDSSGSKVDLKKSSFAGSYFGLQLTLYVNFYDKLRYFNSKNGQINGKRGGLGLLLRIENSSYQNDLGHDGILVQSGVQTDIVINREFKEILPRPYSNCEIQFNSSKVITNSFLYNLISNSKFTTIMLCTVRSGQAY